MKNQLKTWWRDIKDVFNVSEVSWFLMPFLAIAWTSVVILMALNDWCHKPRDNL